MVINNNNNAGSCMHLPLLTNKRMQECEKYGLLVRVHIHLVNPLLHSAILSLIICEITTNVQYRS